MPIKGSPSLFPELGMDLIVIQDGSWIKIMSKLELTSRIMLIIRLFSCMFCENIFKFFKIILYHHSQLNEMRFFGFSEA